MQRGAEKYRVARVGLARYKTQYRGFCWSKEDEPFRGAIAIGLGLNRAQRYTIRLKEQVLRYFLTLLTSTCPSLPQWQ